MFGVKVNPAVIHFDNTMIDLHDDVVDTVTETCDWFVDLRLVKLLFGDLRFKIPSRHHAVRVRCELAGIEYIDTDTAGSDRDGSTGQGTDQDREAGSSEHGETRSSGSGSCSRVRM